MGQRDICILEEWGVTPTAGVWRRLAKVGEGGGTEAETKYQNPEHIENKTRTTAADYIIVFIGFIVTCTSYVKCA